MSITGFQEGWISKSWNPISHQWFHFMIPKDFSVIKCFRSKVATMIISIRALPPTKQWANIKCSSRFVLVNIDCLVTPLYYWCYALVYGTENMQIAVVWAVLHVLWCICWLHEFCCVCCGAWAVSHELCCMCFDALVCCMSCGAWVLVHGLWCSEITTKWCALNLGEAD